MSNFSVNMNTGYTQAACTASSPDTRQAEAGDYNKYDKLLLWQGITQTSIDECTLIEMETYADLAGTDEWDIKAEEVMQKYTGFADEKPYSFVEDGESYGEALETIAQEHIEAYDIIEADGKITYEEYKQSEILEYNAFLPTGETPITEEDELFMQMFKTSFNFMDLNGDSVIDKDEMKAYYVMAGMFDSIEDPPENAADAMDGNIKFTSMQILGDTMAFEAAEGTEEAENREILRSAMTEIYETNKPAETAKQKEGETSADNKEQNQTELPEVQKLTAKGKMILDIEKNLLKNNPFKKQDE